MLLVAADAVDLSVGNVVSARMITGTLFHSAPDFGMAVQAFEAVGSQAKVMAGGAFGRTFEGLVRTREGTGRNLCQHARPKQDK